MHHIAIIDSHFVYRTGLSCILEQHFHSILFADNISTLKSDSEARNFTPDILLLRLSSQHERADFHQLLKTKKLFPGVLLIIYDEVVNHSRAMKVLRAGVKGYLDQKCDAFEIVKCITRVLEGKTYLCDFIQQKIIDQLIHQKQPRLTMGSLSARESEIARLLCSGEKTTAISLILGLKPSTISTVKANIFAKTGANDVEDLKLKLGMN